MKIFAALLLLILLPSTAAGQGSCPSLDAADEPNHTVIFRNSSVRILELQLPRIQVTQPHCHQYTFVMVATSEGRTTDTSISTDWMPGDTRLIYGPVASNIRNEQSTTYRAIEVETMHTLTYSWSWRNQYSDPFGADYGTVKPTWSQTFSRGGLTGTRAQLARGDSLDISTPDHILIAVTALDLEKDGGGRISMERGDTLILPAGSVAKLTNQGSDGAKFVLVEF